MSTTKKLAITGANGYLGQNTIKLAIKNGWNVNAIIRRENLIDEIKNLGATPFVVKNFDINLLVQAFRGCKAVIHFANIVCGSKESFEEVNISGMRNIIKAAIETSVSRIIYPSGMGVDKYGQKEWANNNYFQSKLIAEQLLMNGEVSYIIFRPSYILGLNDELIPAIINQIVNGKVLIAGQGNIPMQPIFLKDATQAFLTAADGVGEANKIYELVGPETINMVELINLILQHMKNAGFNIPLPQFEYIPFDQAPEKLNICKEMVDVMKCDLIADGFKTAQTLGFKLSSLDEAVNATVIEKLVPKLTVTNKKAIILLSGGIDSAVALYWALNKGYKLIALSINYHKRPKQEIVAAKKLADISKIQIIEVPLSFLKEAIDLRMEGFPIPSVVNAPEGYIPLRNLIFYSIAAYYAELYACSYIIGGHIAPDTKTFSDAKRSFFKEIEKLTNKSKNINKDNIKVRFIFPLINMDKKEIVQLAMKLTVPIDLTWSCYHDFDEPCGKCVSCKNRDNALNQIRNKSQNPKPNLNG